MAPDLPTYPLLWAEFDQDLHFEPFGLRTAGLKNLGPHDHVYIGLRELVMHTAFPESTETDHLEMLPKYRSLAANAIKPFLEISRPSMAQQSWHRSSLEKVAQLGIDIHIGQGIDLARPADILESGKNMIARASSMLHPAITPTLVLFAQRHTESQTVQITNTEAIDPGQDEQRQ